MNSFFLIPVVFFIAGLVCVFIAPRVGRNNFVGIRTARSRASDVAWRRINVAGGWGLVVASLIDLIAVFAIVKIAPASSVSALVPVLVLATVGGYFIFLNKISSGI